MGPEGVDAPPAGADTLRQGPRQTPQTKPLPQASLRIRGPRPLRGPLQPDEEAHRRRRIQDDRGLAPKGGPPTQEKPATIGRRPRAGSRPRRHRPPRLEQQRPPRHTQGPGRPRRTARQGQEGLPPRLPEPLSGGHRGLPSGPRRGSAEREREEARGGAAAPGAGGVHRGGAAGRGQPVRVPGRVRPPRVPQDRQRHRLEAAQGQG